MKNIKQISIVLVITLFFGAGKVFCSSKPGVRSPLRIASHCDEEGFLCDDESANEHFDMSREDIRSFLECLKYNDEKSYKKVVLALWPLIEVCIVEFKVDVTDLQALSDLKSRLFDRLDKALAKILNEDLDNECFVDEVIEIIESPFLPGERMFYAVSASGAKFHRHSRLEESTQIKYFESITC